MNVYSRPLPGKIPGSTGMVKMDMGKEYMLDVTRLKSTGFNALFELRISRMGTCFYQYRALVGFYKKGSNGAFHLKIEVNDMYHKNQFVIARYKFLI
jgi:hypothetical protein